jgi:hypothetical protein
VSFSSTLSTVQEKSSTAVVNKELEYQNEYSRLIGTLGEEALKRLQASKILLLGLKGLGLEIGKISKCNNYRDYIRRSDSSDFFCNREV